ncbi:peptidase S8, subtilisin-related protein [Artemisia annua]|uniref:Peptidase S8, subtilisin-related protein n=1 Tax=Artemisia annua TaxID=35608 RepID=A0A2U1LE80_ARTAN|nr:peptidase S8, subtilisin-related protein [Artemisia annua]
MASPSSIPYNNRSVEYNIYYMGHHRSVNSLMAFTYGITLIGLLHQSALMTIAWKFFDCLNREAEFAYGSGHINPLMATDPGLVYETPIEEYLKVWCSLSRTTGSLTATNASCPNESAAREINYPYMAALLDMQSFVVSFPRTVTNEGRANSTYIASMSHYYKY